MTEYSIIFAGEKIGTARVQRQGLYYFIRCRCSFTGDVPMKIVAASARKETDLGLCVPMEGCFGIDTRIPIKRMGEGALSFRAMPRHSAAERMFVRVFPDKPFSCIASLKHAAFERRGDCAGVTIPDQREISKPTGQWSEPNISE